VEDILKARMVYGSVSMTMVSMVVAVVIAPGCSRFLSPRAPRLAREVSVIADRLHAAGEPANTKEDIQRGLQNRPILETELKDPEWFRRCLNEVSYVKVIPKEERSYKPGDDVDYGDTLLEIQLDGRVARELSTVTPLSRKLYFQPDFSDYPEVRKSQWNTRDQFLLECSKVKSGKVGTLSPKQVRGRRVNWSIPEDALVRWTTGRVEVRWNGSIYWLPEWPNPERRTLYGVQPGAERSAGP
jgi:hypothetical protein